MCEVSVCMGVDVDVLGNLVFYDNGSGNDDCNGDNDILKYKNDKYY